MALSFTGNPITSVLGNINTTVSSRCRKYKGFYPSFTPEIGNMSITTSVAGNYSFVSIHGRNFLPNGTTYVNFGNYTNIPVTYSSSYNIAFVVPLNAPTGYYNVVVINTYNSNYSPNINNFYNQNTNSSNSMIYTLT